MLGGMCPDTRPERTRAPHILLLGAINNFSDGELIPLRVFAMEQSGRDPDFIRDQDRLGSHALPPSHQAGAVPFHASWPAASGE